MSDSGPQITVTRGERTKRSRQTQSSSPRSRASGWGLSGPSAVIGGMLRGIRAAWWAGLGTVALARDAGAQAFDALVEEGRSWEQAERERRAQTARRVRALTEESDAVRRVEERIQQEVVDMLQRAGVPSRDEVQGLRDEIEALADRIERLARSVEENNG